MLNFSNFYKCDLRALGLMRIGIALVIIADLLIRFGDLSAHYTGSGVWPSALLRNFGWQDGFWSVHRLFDTYAWELSLFIVHFMAAVFLLIGFKTKLTTLILWLLTVSLHNRNVFILQAGDDLLRMVLLWAVFMPWHVRYSVDSRREKRSALTSGFSYAGYFLLLVSVYFFAAILKYSAEWHQEGSAIYYALSLEQLRLPGIGDWLYGYPRCMQALTWLVLVLEFLIAGLILWPSKKGINRFIAFVLIVVLHAGIGATLYVGLFFVIGMVSAIGLLPGFVFDKLENLLRIKKETSNAQEKPSAALFVVKTFLALTIICLSLIINLSSLPQFNYELNNDFKSATNVLRLNQYWGVFSPTVMKRDGWFVYYGIDSLGRQWDLRRNEDYVDFSKPAHIVNMYKNDRWRKLAENLQSDASTFLRPLYCKYILSNWNSKHPEKKIVTLNLYFMEKKSLPNYQTTAVEKKIFCVCIDD